MQATLEAEATKRRLAGYEPEARKRGRKPKAVTEADAAEAQEIAEIEAEILAGIEEELAAADNTILLEDHVEEVEAEVAAA